MSSRDLHVLGGGPCWRSLCEFVLFSCPIVMFDVVLFCCSNFLMREFMLFCYTMIWWYFPMSCHAFRPWWDVMRFPHDIWCFVWPPMRLLCFYLMRCYAVFAAQFSGKTSSWDGLRYAISYCWRQLKDCLVRCRSCGPPDEVSLFDSVVVCCPVVS